MFGAPILGVWYWCTDQAIVQRVLAARNVTEARRGTIFAGYLKILPVFIFVLPGIIAAALYTDVRGAATDQAFPTLVTRLLPAGLKGLVIAGMLDIPGEMDYARRVYDPEGIAPTITTQQSKMPKIRVIGRANWINGHDLMKRIYSVEGISPTLNTVGGGNREPKIQVYARIRRLSPRECWRLMGFTDHDFDTAKAQTSDSQLYKQAGNSIVVDVITAIFARLFDQHPSVASLAQKARLLSGTQLTLPGLEDAPNG